LPAGYTYLRYGDFRMNPEHPPLVKMLAAIPLYVLHARADTDDVDWKEARQWQFGWKVLYVWNDADRLVFWGRVPFVLLSVLVGIAVARCAARLYGEGAGYLALVLYAVSPDLLAHGQLVTTDLGVTCFMFLSVYSFYRALVEPRASTIIATCLAVGLALLSKFSAVLLFPMLLLVAGVSACCRRRALILGGGVALILAAAMSSLVLIWTAYGWRDDISPPGADRPSLERNHEWTKAGRAAALVRAAHSAGVLPEGYLQGFLTALESTRHRSAFLL